MAKTKISEFSSTPSNNTDIDGINIAEGCAPSGINDAIRELMAQLKDFQTGSAGDAFNGAVNGTLGSTTPAAASVTTLTASGNVTLSGGTTNGIPYLNGSKVVTTGSALQFDGVNLGVGKTPGVKLDVDGTIRSSSATITGSAGGTITPTSASTNQYTVTALGAAATIAIPSGTPIDGQKLTIRIKDNGTARTLTWTTSAGGYRAVGVYLPTTTTLSKVTYVGCIYNSQDSFWDVVAVTTQA